LNKISNLIKIELGWTIDQVLAAIDSFDVVIIDYIQRMEFEGMIEKGNRYKYG